MIHLAIEQMRTKREKSGLSGACESIMEVREKNEEKSKKNKVIFQFIVLIQIRIENNRFREINPRNNKYLIIIDHLMLVKLFHLSHSLS